MKVLHVIPSLSPKHGGPSFCVPMIIESQLQVGMQVDIVTTDDDGPGCRTTVPLGQRIERNGYGIFYFSKQTEFYKISLPLNRWLARHITDYDIVCIHVVFSFSTTSAAWHARRQRVDYIVVPHGVLNRWGMKNRRPFLKMLSSRLVESSILRDAAAMYYTSGAERREAEQSGATARAVIIPHGINVAEYQNLPDPEIFLKRFPQARGKKLVLFLSRLDAKKGLNLLLDSWAENRKSEIGNRKLEGWLLVIGGSGEEDYVRGLRDRAAQLKLDEDIIWTGFLSGVDKLSAFAAATIFILPSYSENFGIALIEAMAAGLPCLTTPGVALAEDVQARAADVLMVVPPETKPLAVALEQLQRNPALREQLGANAKRMATEQFTPSSMGISLKKLYEEILVSRTSRS